MDAESGARNSGQDTSLTGIDGTLYPGMVNLAESKIWGRVKEREIEQRGLDGR